MNCQDQPISHASLIDCHVHLQDDRFGENLPAVVAFAREQGVAKFVCNGSQPADWQQVVDIARQFPGVIPSLGLHPWYVKDQPADWLSRLETMAVQYRTCIGEIGLDKWIADFDPELQKRCFMAQLDLARQLGRPVSIHCLRAWPELFECFNAFGPLDMPVMVHGFGSSPDVAKKLVKRGCFVSFASGILNDSRPKLIEAFAKMPAERILLETDSPDMCPARDFGMIFSEDFADNRINHPANLVNILAKAAAIRDISIEKMGRILAENAGAFLGKFYDYVYR